MEQDLARESARGSDVLLTPAKTVKPSQSNFFAKSFPNPEDVPVIITTLFDGSVVEIVGVLNLMRSTNLMDSQVAKSEIEIVVSTALRFGDPDKRKWTLVRTSIKSMYWRFRALRNSFGNILDGN